MMAPNFEPGDRVRVVGHWEFEDGIIGTIREPDTFIRELGEPQEWRGCRRIFRGPKGVVVSYWVEFDEPHDDGSGDGPYRAAEIDASALELLGDDGQSPPAAAPGGRR